MYTWVNEGLLWALVNCVLKSFFVSWSLKQIIEVGPLWIRRIKYPIANDQWPIDEATYAFMTNKEG